ncbi:B12-binding domain-containing radical SAM protein [Solidesulfovibrio sp. C21]|uniref:B12-binding domain-containing radical SAM protein n=1 Tax=Solidesulfovibrio sp. C21 TaxID=3398613 RepID=UPI0039FC8EBE
MNVLFANLAGVKVDPDGKVRHFIKAGSRWPMTIGYAKSVDYYPFPFWLAYALALCKRDTKAACSGLDGVVMDFTDAEMLVEVKRRKPDLIVTELAALTLADDLRFLDKLKRETGCKVLVAGNHATVAAEALLTENACLDFAAIGEYEMTVKDVIEALMAGREDLSDIPGLVCRKDGQIVNTGRRELLADLDSLPFPDREDFPATIYPDFTLYSPCINIVSSRGCPCGCVYCQERHIMYASPRYRPRDPQKVAEEMEYCIKRFGAKQFYFDDQSFVVKKSHVLGICAAIKERGIKIPWTVMGDAMFVDRETLFAMADAGCIGMKFGVESADPGILKAIGKPLDLDKCRQVVKWCRECGIRTHATFCLGLPGETEETIKKSLTFMEELDADTAQVSKAVPYPGTPMYAWASERGYLVAKDLTSFDGMGSCVVGYPDLPAAEIDRWYGIFSRRVARKKLLKYISEPGQSLSILMEMGRRKGVASVLKSAWTFVTRAFR